MLDPFIGEIQIFAFGFAPKYWMQCNGQLLSISSNTALFSLLGTMYGGNGTTTFALPDFRGRVGLHIGQLPGGNYYSQGQVSGQSTQTISTSQMPAHNHLVRISDTRANLLSPNNAIIAQAHQPAFSDALPGALLETPTNMLPSTSISGASQPHTNMQPYLGVNICICTQGIFPSRN